MTSSTFAILRRHLALFCCSLALVALAGVARADDAATFSDPEVTAYAKDFSGFVDQYIVVMKDYMAAAKTNDTAKLQVGAAKIQEFQTKLADLQTRGTALGGKVKPEEAQRFSDYMTACAKRMSDALQAQ